MIENPQLYISFGKDLYRISTEKITSDSSDIDPDRIISGSSISGTSQSFGYIQSANFITGTTGWRLNSNGDMEANTGTFRGTLIANTLHIPDENTTVNSFHVESDGDTFWGCTQTNFTADNDNAKAYILKSGVAKFQSITYIGSATQYLDFNETNIVVKGVLNLIGTLQLKSYTVATLPVGYSAFAFPTANGTYFDDWTNPTNAYTDDGNYATALSNDVYNDYSVFGINVPTSTSSIVGIEVKVEGHYTGGTGTPTLHINITKGGDWIATSKSANLNLTTDTVLTFGGPTDLWGETGWSYGDFTDPIFWLRIQGKDGGGNATVSVDYIKIKVYYIDTQNPIIAGSVTYASNGRKAGEGAGNGTGVLVFYDLAGNWIACDTGATVAA